MKTYALLSALLALTLAACGQQESPPAAGQSSQSDAAAAVPPVAAVLKSGEQVYRQVCMGCHAAGVASAPKAGDTESWAALKEEGQAVVTAHGWVGVRGMPPKGGRADLGLEEFARATAWMARSAGLDWQDPDEALLSEIREEEIKRIESLKSKS